MFKKIRQKQQEKFNNSQIVFGIIVGQKRNGLPVIKFWADTDKIKSTHLWATGYAFFSTKKVVSEDVEAYDEFDEYGYRYGYGDN
jgi:hypothetical protein